MAGGVEFILRWGQPGGAGGLNIAKIHFLEMLEKLALDSYETSERRSGPPRARVASLSMLRERMRSAPGR